MLKPYSQFINEIQFTDTLNSFLTEKIDPSVAKQFMDIDKNPSIKRFQDKIWQNLQQHDQFVEASKRQDRLYFEFEPDPEASDPEDSQIYPVIIAALQEFGYKVVDYIKGIAKKDKNDQQVKIGKVLSKISQLDKKAYDEYRDQIDHIYELLERDNIGGPLNIDSIDELKDKFDSDKVRVSSKASNKDYQIVLSRHSYDIAGMSSDRGWTSCMDLYKSEDSENKEEYISKDIQYGSIIGYLIKDDDTNIENPVGRVMIRPFVHVSDDVDQVKHGDDRIIYVVEEKIYGTNIGGFRNKVVEIVNSVQDAPDPGRYNIIDGVYCENEEHGFSILSSEAQSILKSKQKTTDPNIVKQFMEYLFGRDNNKGYSINSDGSVDIFNHLFPTTEISQNIVVLPIYINKVDGSCNFNDLGLETLEGAPNYVGEDFSIIDNLIKDLKGGPNQVNGNYNCLSNNYLESLEGLAESIGGKLGLPKHIDDKYTVEQIREISNIQGEINFE